MGDFFVPTSAYYSQCLSGAYGRGFMGDMPPKLLEIFFWNIVGLRTVGKLCFSVEYSAWSDDKT